MEGGFKRKAKFLKKKFYKIKKGKIEMKKFISYFVLASLLLLIACGLVYSQEQPMVNATQWYGNNTQINNDMSGMPETRIITPQETYLMNEIQRLREMNDQSQNNRIRW